MIDWDFLQGASTRSLEECELFHLNQADLKLKQLLKLMREWNAAMADAGTVRSEIDKRKSGRMGFDPLQKRFDFPESPIGASPAKANHAKGGPRYRAAAD